jgi:hypothetical protein
MTTPDCSQYLERIPRSFLGDLTAGERQALEEHLAACSSCRSEHAKYANTLQQIDSLNDDPVGRHFFVYPEATHSKPWELFRRMGTGWQAATAAFVLVLILIGTAGITQLQIRSDRNGWVISFNRNPIDASALRADILRAAEERDRAFQITLTRELETEIAHARADLTHQQRVDLVNALTSVESRLASRLSMTANGISAATQKLVLDIYQTSAQQRLQELRAIQARLDSTDQDNAVKDFRTDTILDTLLQVAELKLK